MAKELERDLGLYAVLTVSIGAMLGSGIFVLPGIAATMAGPAVILAYVLAGLIALPAAVSKAEMATAMPEAGGTYLYIDRAMGPFMGTIAGIGVWFSLTFKSAFALVGLGSYLVLFAAFPTKLVALGLGLGLIVLNVLGAKQTGGVQATIVTIVLAVLLWFIGTGSMSIDVGNFDPFFSQGVEGLLAATGFVFVSYAGVTKIASVAEEVEDPSRNIPLGILGSILGMMLLYALIVGVVVGVLEPSEIGKTLTPMADAAQAFLGEPGVVLVSATAVLALTGMANAGILSASRYPLAMSRDDLAPEGLRKISERFRTPATAIAVTGTLLLFLIVTVPVIELAKLASAFKILVFVLINFALIALREGHADWYEPAFRSPLYPWIQILGALGGLTLLTQMGLIPVAGAVGLVLAGTAWYQFYAKRRTTREGVGVDVLRRRGKERRVAETVQEMRHSRDYRILVPVPKGMREAREQLLLRMAAAVARDRDGEILVVRFEEVPEQTTLSFAASTKTEEDIAFEKQTDSLSGSLEVPVYIGEVVSHDSPRAVKNYVRRHEVDVVLADAEFGPYESRLFREGIDRLLAKVPCDVVLVKRNQGVREVESVAVTSTGAPFDPVKVRIANAVAGKSGAPVRLVHALNVEATDAQLKSVQAYHEELDELTTVPTESVILREDDQLGALLRAVADDSVVIVGADDPRLMGGGLRGSRASKIAEIVPGTTLIVRARGRRRSTFVQRLIERVLY